MRAENQIGGLVSEKEVDSNAEEKSSIPERWRKSLSQHLPFFPQQVRDFLSKSDFRQIVEALTEGSLPTSPYDPDLPRERPEEKGPELLCPYYFSSLGDFSRRNSFAFPARAQAEGFVFYSLGFILTPPRLLASAEKAKELSRSFFLFSLLYLLVDSYLDQAGEGSDLQEVLRALALARRKESSTSDHAAEEPAKFTICSLPLRCAVGVYRELVEFCPRCEPSLLRAFQAELAGAGVQKQGGLPEEEYREVMLEKGRTTALVIHALSGTEEDPASWARVGEIIQILDDALDADEDRKAGIYTAATFNLEKGRNLEAFLLEGCEKIGEISSPLSHTRPLFAAAAAYVASESPHFSYSLRRSLRPWTPFDSHLGFRALEAVEERVKVSK